MCKWILSPLLSCQVSNISNEFILIKQQCCPNFLDSEFFFMVLSCRIIAPADEQHRFKSKVIYLLLFIKPQKNSTRLIALAMLLIHSLFSSEPLTVLAVRLHFGKMPLYHPTWAILLHNVQHIQVNSFLVISLCFHVVILMSYMCRV